MKKFVTPYSAAEGEGGMDALEGILAGMDSGEDSASGEPDNAQQQEPDQGSDAGGEAQNNQRSAQDKQNYAFGQMRTQISALTSLLGKVAKANGIEFASERELMDKLNDDAIEKMAHKDNVPVELLRKLEMLERDSAAFRAQQQRDAAAVGFQNLVNEYGLTQQQLEAFAVELDQQGKNPFTSNVDLMAEYKLLHFDDIVQAKVNRAVQEALAKSGAADQHSSTPGANQGGNGGNPDKITTVAGLTELLNAAN